MSIIGWIKGCLSFTLANQSVDGLGKWYTKFRTGKFRAGITFTICTNPFHSPRNDREGLKDGFKEMEHEFLFGIFHSEKQATFSDASFSPEIFRWNDPRSRVPFTFQPGFTETFWHGKQSVYNQSLIDYKYIWTAMLTSTLALRVHITPKLKKE